MTNSEAIEWLRHYRRDIPRFNYGFGALHRNDEFMYQSFEQYIVSELIDIFKVSPNSDPIQTVYRLYCDLDYILEHSDEDHLITHKYASIMENIARDILRYLREKEIRKRDQFIKSSGTNQNDI